MEHLANKLDARRLIGIGFFEVHDEAERAIFERCICRSDDDGIPSHGSVLSHIPLGATPFHSFATLVMVSRAGGGGGIIPGHDIVGDR